MTVGQVIVVGGGIAGASAAYALAQRGGGNQVTLIEAETQLAQHTTGRSAALLTENYGAGPTRPLTRASIDFLHNPPEHLVDHPLLHQRGIMTVATQRSEHGELEQQLAEGAGATSPIVEIDLDDAAAHAPHIRFGPDHRVMWEQYAHDIDVAGLHQAYVRGLRAAGGRIATSHRLDSARPTAAGWSVDTTAGRLDADVLVNAAGAWGDVVAVAAGIAPIGLQPMRRTAFMVTSPFPDSSEYPFVASAAHTWYLRPDGRQFMCSPADETPSEPCDARAEEIDIARTIDDLNQNTELQIRSITTSWAGLRTFAPDRSMVIGPDPSAPNFIWCVGQGGIGIQTSPAAGELVADLVLQGDAGAELIEAGVDLSLLLPDRFR